LRAGDLVGICGDSITEQKIYSVDIADYLLMCQPKPKLVAKWRTLRDASAAAVVPVQHEIEIKPAP
jgi:hypothetical protein